MSSQRENSASVTVIVRAAGERTVDACCAILAQQVPSANIVTLCEAPFVRAVQRTFEIGIAENRPWTLVIDADVLLRPDAVSTLLNWGIEAADHVFEVQGMVLDKLMGGPRAAGNHLFRTSLLPQALEHARSDGAANSLRPETYVMRRMEEAGHPWVQQETVLGLHDYEQAYRDIYRTAFVHAHKHGHQLPYLVSLWQRLAPVDADYQVALWGAEEGRAHQGEIQIDVRQFSQQRIQQRLDAVGLSEKNVLDSEHFDTCAPERIVDEFQPPPEYWVWQYLGRPSGPRWPERLRRLSEHLPWHTMAIWSARTVIYRLRDKLS